MQEREGARGGLDRNDLAHGSDAGGGEERVVADVRTDIDEDVAGRKVLFDDPRDVWLPHAEIEDHALDQVLRIAVQAGAEVGRRQMLGSEGAQGLVVGAEAQPGGRQRQAPQRSHDGLVEELNHLSPL